MKISATLKTAEYRGDHDADVTIALDFEREEILQEFVIRNIKRDRFQDWIELRLVRPAAE